MQKCVEHAVPTRLTQTFTKDARLLFQSGSATVIDNSHAEGKKSVSVCVCVYGMVEHAVMLFLLMGIVISTNGCDVPKITQSRPIWDQCCNPVLTFYYSLDRLSGKRMNPLFVLCK